MSSLRFEADPFRGNLPDGTPLTKATHFVAVVAVCRGCTRFTAVGPVRLQHREARGVDEVQYQSVQMIVPSTGEAQVACTRTDIRNLPG